MKKPIERDKKTSKMFLPVGAVIGSILIAVVLAIFSMHHTKTSSDTDHAQLAGQLSLPSTRPNGQNHD